MAGNDWPRARRVEEKKNNKKTDCVYLSRSLGSNNAVSVVLSRLGRRLTGVSDQQNIPVSLDKESDLERTGC